MDISPITSRKSGDQSTLTRSPLSNRANIHLDTTTTNWDHKDSSEGQPSTHDSVCDAAWISTSDLAKSPYQTPGRPATPLRSIDIDLESESPLSRLETPFLYGHGTELAPILEQRSIATLRTKQSHSTSDLSSLLHDAPHPHGGGGGGGASLKPHSKSDETTTTTTTTTMTTKMPSRFHLYLQQQQRSSSDADIDDDEDEDNNNNNNNNNNDDDDDDDPAGTATISTPRLRQLRYSRPTVHLVDVHAYPQRPVYAAPRRAATPPSLRRVARPRSEGDAYVASGGGASPGGVAHAYAAPGFRPVRSGHGNLSAHPFMTSTTTNTTTNTTAFPSSSTAAYYHHHHHHPTTTTTTAAATAAASSSSSSSSSSTSAAARLRLRSVIHHGRRGGGDSTGPLDGSGGYFEPPDQQRMTRTARTARTTTTMAGPGPGSSDGGGNVCKKCSHPRGEPWSLASTLVGHGPGARRGADWCGRCACRKIARRCCCGGG